MEALLQSGLATKAGLPIADQAADPTPEATITALEKDMSNLVLNDAGEQKYIGPSSGFSLFSPRSLAWMSHKLGSPRMLNLFTRLHRQGFIWPTARFEGKWDGQFRRSPLPSKQAAVYLVDRFFSTFNKSYPLFRRDTFQALFDRQYADESAREGSSFAALNIVLAIGCCIAPESLRENIQRVEPSCTDNLTQMSWKLFQNAYSMFFNILFLQFDLLSVQTLIAMVMPPTSVAFFMQATVNPEGSFLLIGTAARIATSLGLHRKLEGFGLEQVELEQRQRVFWVMYIFEKDLCVRTGRPSAIDDCDVGISILTEPCDEEIAISVGTRERVTFYPFQHMCAIAVIQSKVYRELYAVHSRVGTTAERLESISKLDAELQHWKEQIPVDARPEHPIVCERDSQFAIAILHFNYYHCLIAIHRIHAQHELWVAQQAEVESTDKNTPESFLFSDREESRSQQQSSYELCLAAARSILYLAAAYLDGSHMQHKLLWISTYFPLSAFLTLFTNILQRPLSEKAESDLVIMVNSYDRLRHIFTKEDEMLYQFVAALVGETVSSAEQYIRDARAREAANAVQATIAEQSGTTSNPSDGGIDRSLDDLNYPAQPGLSAPAFDPVYDMNTFNPMTDQGSFMGGTFTGQGDLPSSYVAGFDSDEFSAPFFANLPQFESTGMVGLDTPFPFTEYGGWSWTPDQ
ncbi:hypothetical protein H2204_004455 [Knufia peltigerae]|uniref:Xylanolytic transcriptional activator regulatory domain-containing protein n=1 Tax=Knufia peltigerae TaxID=1002370 RepID=A0AA39CZF3_9EURO|nr:hypothetical protein H2204_004455 [Knufia peltigerae]